MEHNKILLVDDEAALREMVGGQLTTEGFCVQCAAHCAEALQLLRRWDPDAAILDVMLPDGDGFWLLEQLRQTRPQLPVLFLSARDEDSARLHGLGLGADDYITKPFLMQELSLRLRAVLRRVYGVPSRCPAAVLGTVTIDWDNACVRRADGTQESLTAKEYALLKKLWDERGRIVTIDALCRALWEGELFGYENTLMVHIRHLRTKIEPEPSRPVYLQTVRGLGYRLALPKTEAKL